MLRGLGSSAEDAKCTCLDVPAVLFPSGFDTCSCHGEVHRRRDMPVIRLRKEINDIAEDLACSTTAYREDRYLPREKIMANTFARLEHIPDVKKVR